MKVYFVRHGESENSAYQLYSSPELNLTEKGGKQAELTAERVAKLPIEIIISSSYKRTLQTTQIINKKLNKKVFLSDLAVEIKRPTEIAGKSISDLGVRKIKKQMDQNFHLPNWHYSDEENFYDFKARVEKFIKFLEKFEQKHILVVTHIHFIRIIVLTLMFGKDLTAEMFLKHADFLEMETSGLTICEKDKTWKLVTWNDHAHLADSSQGFSG